MFFSTKNVKQIAIGTSFCNHSINTQDDAIGHKKPYYQFSQFWIEKIQNSSKKLLSSKKAFLEPQKSLTTKYEVLNIFHIKGSTCCMRELFQNFRFTNAENRVIFSEIISNNQTETNQNLFFKSPK